MRKLSIWLLFLLITKAGVATAAISSSLGTDPTPEATKIIEYLNGVINIKNQADAIYMLMPPPRDPSMQQIRGASIADKRNADGRIIEKGVEDTVKKIMANKELMDLAFGLYEQPRPGEKRAKGLDPYTILTENHISKYCSPTTADERKDFKCGGTGVIPKNYPPKPPFGKSYPYTPCDFAGDKFAADSDSVKYEYGDIKLSGLMEPLFYREGRDDLVEAQIADEVIRNLINPFPDLGDLKLNKLGPGGDFDNKKAYAKYLANQAALDAARYSLNQMFAMRLSCDTGNADDERKPSILEVLAEESKARFTDSDWYDKVATSSVESLLRELVYMKSFKLWMGYHRLQSAHRQEVVKAVLLANYVRATFEQEKQFAASKNAESITSSKTP